MNRLSAFLPLAFISSLLAPLYVRAADLPLFSSGWSLVPEACRDCPCGLAGVLSITQNLINVGISIGILLFVVIIAWAGFLFIASATNPESRSKAKSMLLNAAIGMMIVLSAWLMVDFIMKTLYNPNNAGWGPWNTILGDTTGKWCVESTATQPLFSGAISVTQLTTSNGGSGGSGRYTPGGTCSTQETGACAYTNFAAFTTAAREGSQICNAESRGNASIASSVDKLGDGTPYSWGLFQINLTAHKVAGLDCPSAFSKQSCTVSSCGPGTGVRVVNADLFNRCVAAAKIPANNIATAHKVYLDAHASWRPWGTARGCGLALEPKGTNLLAMLSVCTPEQPS